MFHAHSLIFSIGFRIVFFISQLLAIYLLLRGHHQPGGGFIGGLVCALSLLVLSFDIGTEQVKRVLKRDPLWMALCGVLISLLVGCLGLFLNDYFMQQYMFFLNFPLLGDIEIGTPLFFDIGVFLVVVGVFTKIIFMLFDIISHKDVFSEKCQVIYKTDEYEQIVVSKGEGEHGII